MMVKRPPACSLGHSGAQPRTRIAVAAGDLRYQMTPSGLVLTPRALVLPPRDRFMAA